MKIQEILTLAEPDFPEMLYRLLPIELEQY